MLTPFPYLNYYYKFIALVMAIAGILLMIIPTDFGKYSGWLLLFYCFYGF